MFYRHYMENSQINYTAASDESKALYHEFLIKFPAIYVVRRKLILFSQLKFGRKWAWTDILVSVVLIWQFLAWMYLIKYTAPAVGVNSVCHSDNAQHLVSASTAERVLRIKFYRSNHLGIGSFVLLCSFCLFRYNAPVIKSGIFSIMYNSQLITHISIYVFLQWFFSKVRSIVSGSCIFMYQHLIISRHHKGCTIVGSCSGLTKYLSILHKTNEI